MTANSDLPDYAPERFVNRTPEIEKIAGKIEQLMANQLVQGRTVIVTGEHGMGKSWLLRHLHWQWAPHTGLKTCLVDLAAFDRRLLPADVLRTIYGKLADWLLGENKLPNADNYTKLRYLLGELNRCILAHMPLMLLVDSVYESPPAWLAELEEHLLAPLAVERKVLLVLAGRGIPYPWRQAELRLRAEFDSLEPFVEEATAAQLAGQTSAGEAQAIHALTKGNPKANWLLARQPDRVVALDHMIDEMLAPIAGGEQRAKARLYMEVVAVPRSFDENLIPMLLAAHQDSPALRELTRPEVRKMLDLLLAPGLVYWNSELGGYTLHPSTRNLLLRFLCAAESARWQRLHQEMLTLYGSWIQDYPQNSQRWQEEAAFLRQQLAGQCP